MYFLTETTEEVEILTEETTQGKRLFIEGVFSSAEKPNRNKRVYSKPVMETAVSEYKKNYIDTKKAIGEINHPNTPIPDMRKAAILIESLDWKGSDVIGKASIMSTPEGKILQGLIESGYKVGISSRGTGSVKMNNGINEVQKDFRMFAYDVVSNPSNYGSEMDSMIEGIMEGSIWVPSSDEIIDDIKEASSKNLADAKAKAFTQILKGLHKS